MIDLPLPKSTRALFSAAEIGDDEPRAAAAAKASSSSAATLLIIVGAAAISFDSAVQAFDFFVFIAKTTAGVANTLWRFPGLWGVAFIGGRSGTPESPLMKVLDSDLARRRFWCAPGPDDDDNDSGASGGGDNTVFSSDVDVTRSRDVLVIGVIPVCKLTLRVLRRARADRGFGITIASMKTLLRLRLCCGGCGVGDGLRLHGRGSVRGGIVAKAVRTAACCGLRCAAELGVIGDNRHCRTSSHSASLSSSVSAPRSSPSPLPSFDFLVTRPPRLFFLGGESNGTLLARLLPSLGVPGEEAAIAMRSSREGRATGFGGVFSLSEEHGPSEVFLGERSGDRGDRDGDRGDRDGEEAVHDAVPMTKL